MANGFPSESNDLGNDSNDEPTQERCGLKKLMCLHRALNYLNPLADGEHSCPKGYAELLDSQQWILSLPVTASLPSLHA